MSDGSGLLLVVDGIFIESKVFMEEDEDWIDILTAKSFKVGKDDGGNDIERPFDHFLTESLLILKAIALLRVDLLVDDG